MNRETYERTCSFVYFFFISWLDQSGDDSYVVAIESLGILQGREGERRSNLVDVYGHAHEATGIIGNVFGVSRCHPFRQH